MIACRFRERRIEALADVEQVFQGTAGVDEIRTGGVYTLLTRGTSNDAAPPLVFIQMSHLVVRASQLEAEDGLKILSLEEDFAFEAVAEI